jgi:hypothetical protein
MTLLEIAGGFVAGMVAGVGISVFYIRWKVRRQLGAMQGQMEQMMDMTQGMGGLGENIHEEPVDTEESFDEKED